MKRVLVQFDGSNFYNKVKKSLPQIHLTHFDYIGLAKEITKINNSKVVYYVGEIKKYPGSKKSQTLCESTISILKFAKTRNRDKTRLSVDVG